LPLLEGLGRTPHQLRHVAERALAVHPRAAQRVAPTDAWHIAEAALAEPALAAAARLDLLMLRARFSSRGRAMARCSRGPRHSSALLGWTMGCAFARRRVLARLHP
jgi:hypothetical protein